MLRTLDELIATDLIDDFNDPEFVRGYLESCLEEAQAHKDIGIFLVAVQHVINAKPAWLASGVSSGSLDTGNISSLQVVGKLGLTLQMVPRATKLQHHEPRLAVA